VKAMVLAAGYGTRLGNLTRAMPKPLLPVGDRPLLEYIICHLARHGFDEIAVNLHFMPETVREFLGDGSRWNIDIEYSAEPELLGTAGGVKKMEHFFRDTDAFLIQYGDILTDQDLTALHQFHRDKQALITMLVHQRARSNSIVEMDDDHRILRFWERPDDRIRQTVKSPWVNSAVYVCDPAVLQVIHPTDPCDLPRDVFPQLIDSGRLFGFPLTGYRCAVDSPQRYAAAQAAVHNGQCDIDLPPKTSG